MLIVIDSPNGPLLKEWTTFFQKIFPHLMFWWWQRWVQSNMMIIFIPHHTIQWPLLIEESAFVMFLHSFMRGFPLICDPSVNLNVDYYNTCKYSGFMGSKPLIHQWGIHILIGACYCAHRQPNKERKSSKALMIGPIKLSSSLWERGHRIERTLGLNFLTSSMAGDKYFLLTKFARNINCESQEDHIKKQEKKKMKNP